MVDSPDEAAREAERILGMQIKGHPVSAVLVEEAAEIRAEYYAAVLLDRSERTLLAMTSSRGGVDIEEVARETPEAILKAHFSPLVGLRPYVVRRLTREFPPEVRETAAGILEACYQLYIGSDCQLVEINPLALLADGRLVALDAKVTVDDNALYRQPEIAPWRKVVALDPYEQEVKERGLAYVRLQGEVGIIGNGAGLVMSSLDLVARAGGRPANFLDVGGGASAEVIAAALEAVLGDPQVKVVLLNIFGGITRCDVVAEGILKALEQVGARVPIVVRLDGTNAPQGREMLASARVEGLVAAAAMDEAAERAVALAARA